MAENKPTSSVGTFATNRYHETVLKAVDTFHAFDQREHREAQRSYNGAHPRNR